MNGITYVDVEGLGTRVLDVGDGEPPLLIHGGTHGSAPSGTN